MIRFIPTSTLAVAESLSSALWALSRPQPQSTTKLFATLVCLDSSTWLAVDTEFSIPLHPEAVLGPTIAGILQPWITEGALPVDTLENLSGLIEATRGQRLTVWDAFPPLFHTQSKTREELVALNLLPSIA